MLSQGVTARQGPAVQGAGRLLYVVDFLHPVGGRDHGRIEGYSRVKGLEHRDLVSPGDNRELLAGRGADGIQPPTRDAPRRMASCVTSAKSAERAAASPSRTA